MTTWYRLLGHYLSEARARQEVRRYRRLDKGRGKKDMKYRIRATSGAWIIESSPRWTP